MDIILIVGSVVLSLLVVAVVGLIYYLINFRKSQHMMAEVVADLYKDVHILKLTAQFKGKVAYVSTSGTGLGEILGSEEADNSEDGEDDGGGDSGNGEGGSGPIH